MCILFSDDSIFPASAISSLALFQTLYTSDIKAIGFESMSTKRVEQKIRVFATLSISPSIPVTGFRHELIPCRTVGRAEELHCESGLELLITHSV